MKKGAKRMQRRDDMQRRFSSQFVVRLVAMLALMATFAMLGCSDDEDEVRNVNVGALRITEANAAMLGGEDFPFANGVGALGTAGTSTQVEFNDDATGADIAAGGSTASAGAEYGSCIFTVAESTFPTTHPLATGSIITIQRCILNITAVDVPVNGDPVAGVAILTLGLAESSAVEVEVQLDEDGRLFVNGVDTGITITGSEGDTDN
jgi:hypothetical protein